MTVDEVRMLLDDNDKLRSKLSALGGVLSELRDGLNELQEDAVKQQGRLVNAMTEAMNAQDDKRKQEVTA